MIEVIFEGVSITVSARDAATAYDDLCAVLDRAGLKFSTRTYETYSDGRLAARGKTTELWPAQRRVRGEG